MRRIGLGIVLRSEGASLLRRVAIVVAVALGPACGGAWATSTLSFQAVSVPTADGKDVVGKVRCGSALVMTMPGRGQASLDRAMEMARRLDELADAGLRAGDIEVVKVKRARIITVRGDKLITVDRKTARAMGMSVDGLAKRWTENLQAQFSRPYLSMQPVVIPLGESRTAPVLGNVSGPVETEIDNPEVFNAMWDGTQRSVLVAGRQVGHATLIVLNGQNTLRVPVRVAKYAAQLTGPLTAVVTGNPAPPEVVQAAAEARVEACLRLEPGAQCDVSAFLADVAPPSPGASAQVPVNVSADGGDYLPYRLRPTVAVANQQLSLPPISFLWVSNSPERLLSHGLWFEGLLGDNQATRLLYHHVNNTNGRAILAVELWNLGTDAAQVHVLAATGGPSYDEAWVGHRAAREFLRSRVDGAGWVVDVPPGAAVTAISQVMPIGSVASGVAEFRALGPANLSVRVYLKPPASDIGPRPIDRYYPSPLLGQWHYPQPERDVTASYQVGGAWSFTTIGHQPAIGVAGGDRLLGSYGVLYNIAVELSNPTADAVEVELIMEPAGGPARAALVVDGRVAEVAMLRNTSESPFAKYLLLPGQSRTVHVTTMPQAGSNYPVRLVARPL